MLQQLPLKTKNEVDWPPAKFDDRKHLNFLDDEDAMGPSQSGSELGDPHELHDASNPDPTPPIQTEPQRAIDPHTLAPPQQVTQKHCFRNRRIKKQRKRHLARFSRPEKIRAVTKQFFRQKFRG